MKTALVLGGGGPIGIAWEAGLILGLADRGVDLAKADLIIGTSAGAIVGADLATLGSVEQLFASQATPVDQTMKPPQMAPLMAAFVKAKLLSRDVEKQRRSLGKSARAAKIPGEQEWLNAIASFLPKDDGVPLGGWPARDLLLTAIDIETGKLETWTRDSGVPLPIAVASSCAVPCVYPLVHIGDRPYMDGGMGSPTNAMLAKGFDLVVVADPLLRMMGSQSPLLSEKVALKKEGSRVVCFGFDEATGRHIGMNLMDAGKRGRVAELGRAQGRQAAEQASSAAGRLPSESLQWLASIG